MLSVLNKLLNRVEALASSLDSGEALGNILRERSEDILTLQRIQLLEGRASSGEDLRPYYSEDLKPGGYFYSTDSAGRYAAWKGSLSYPYSVQRNEDAPNLYINGRFHSELDVQFLPDGVAIVAGTGYAEGIMMKYGFDNFGLTPEGWEQVFTTYGAADALYEFVNKSLLYGN